MEQVSQYGVEFFRVSSRNVQIQASSPNLAIYLGTFTSDITQIEEFLTDVDFALSDKYGQEN